MIGMIAAVTSNGVIGVDGKIPFDYPEDMAHFRMTTIDSIVIMGRKTFEGIGKPLPRRSNIVVSSSKIPGIVTKPSLGHALSYAFSYEERFHGIWLIGGAKIYEAGMDFADKIVLTITPDIEKSDKAIRFPWINPLLFTQHHSFNIELGETSKSKAGVPALPVFEYYKAY